MMSTNNVYGNAAALREALAALVAYWDWNGFDAMRESRLKDMARAALSAPPRNCDVGTAEEQSRRFDKVCSFRFTGNCAGCQNPLDDSAANGVGDCALFWAQMPYEKGETDGSK